MHLYFQKTILHVSYYTSQYDYSERTKQMEEILNFQKISVGLELVILGQPSQIEGEEKKSVQTNCRFTTISSQISAIYMNIFHKTEVQTVILRC